MATPLSVSTSLDDGTAVLSVVGEIDMSNVGVFATAIADAMVPASHDGGVLTIDLTRVEYLDSAAIGALFDQAERIRLIVNPMLRTRTRAIARRNVTAATATSRPPASAAICDVARAERAPATPRGRPATVSATAYLPRSAVPRTGATSNGPSCALASPLSELG